jgi:hypothetical protein
MAGLMLGLQSSQPEPVRDAPRVEVTGRVGLGTLVRYGDDFTDSGAQVGAGAIFRVYRRIAFEVELSRIMNLNPVTQNCWYYQPCLIAGLETGVRSSTLVSFGALYYFKTRSPIRPYAIGTIGMLRSRVADISPVFAPPNPVTVISQDRIDRGVAMGFGVGVALPIAGGLSLRPEFRLQDASIRSRSNLALIQTGFTVGYAW